ncbi:MAG: CPBP family intramembrane metalloprotease [Planctomycetes bacterium]|nr:CPBP family intramembrane metalloprotease [Planctomycetota bacterium]
MQAAEGVTLPTMGRKKKEPRDYPTGQLLNFARDSYLERTSRPVYAILFLLPFLIFYEIGTSLINTDLLTRYQLRVVAFVWIQDALLHLGTSSRFAWVAPPLVVVVILVGLQVASKKQWYFCFSDYLPMLLECVLLAVPLIVLSLLSNSPSTRPDHLNRPQSMQPPAQVQMAASTRIVSPEQIMAALGQQEAAHPKVHSLLANVVTGVGAGIYEELVFRLILICALMVLFQDVIGLSHQNAIALSVLMSAALFSAHHHIIWIDGRLARSAPFNWTEFGFRTIAGIYFALLFAIRGFGITAGTHAFYDILATLINAIFFDY